MKHLIHFILETLWCECGRQDLFKRPTSYSSPPSLTAPAQHNQTLTSFISPSPLLQRAQASGFAPWPACSRPGTSWPDSPSVSFIPRSTFVTAPSPHTHLSRECLMSIQKRSRKHIIIRAMLKSHFYFSMQGYLP